MSHKMTMNSYAMTLLKLTPVHFIRFYIFKSLGYLFFANLKYLKMHIYVQLAGFNIKVNRQRIEKCKITTGLYRCQLFNFFYNLKTVMAVSSANVGAGRDGSFIANVMIYAPLVFNSKITG